MAQQLSNQAVIKIGATAEGSFEPDTAKFVIWFGKRCKTQDACSEDFARELDAVRTALASFGISDELKTSAYTTWAHRTSRKSIIDGYDYQCKGIIKLDTAKYNIQSVWEALMNSGIHGEVDLRFELTDESSAEDSLIEQAVDRARHNAQTFAQTLGMSLGGVREIRYHRKGDLTSSTFFGSEMSVPAPSGPLDQAPQQTFTPDPIEVECSVDIDWWLV